MEKFTTKSTSHHSQIVNEPIIIDDGENTRKIFIAELNDTKLHTGETVSGTIVHQRKNKKDEWENVEAINLNSLKGGEGVKLNLRSAHVKNLYDGLTKLYALSMKGVNYGEKEYVIGTSDEIITIPAKRKKYIEELLQANHGEEVWKELIELNPDLATKLAYARIQSNRTSALNEFKNSLESNNKSEDYWQEFFTNNDWIFGYGLNYKFLVIESDQPNYGGENYTGKGKQKGDYLAYSESEEIKFTVLVEIKKSNSPLLAKTAKGDNVRYRNGAWLLGSELLGGVSQLQINCKTWQKSAEELKNKPLIDKDIFTVKPKGILVIGNTKQFNNEIEKLTSFELFRQSISNIEIVTFDELYERAKYIVGNISKIELNKSDENFDEYPF